MVGMLMMLKVRLRPGLASTSTLTTSTAPSYFLASFSSSGATSLQGPHQAAQKSTITGRADFRTSSSKVVSVACLISTIGRNPFSRANGAGMALAGQSTDETVRFEDTRVRDSVVDGAPVATGAHEAGAPQD